MKMKKIWTMALAAVMALSTMVSPAFAEAEQSADLLARIQERGEIVIAAEGTYPPWNYHDEDDNLVGYDVEVAQKVAEILGVKATFVECEWDSIFAGLDSERYDMVANEVEITEDRSQKYDFSTPYAYIYTVVIVKADNEDITCFEDLNGKTTANTLSSTYAALSESYGANTLGVDSLSETLELVLAGRVDATLNADVSFYDYMNTHTDAPLKVVASTADPVVASFPVRKGDDSATLLAAIDDALAQLDEQGVLSELSIKYFGNDVSQAADAEEAPAAN